MSAFLETVEKFRKEFRLSPWDASKIYFHYPAFKAAWLAEYGSGWKKTISQKILKACERSSFPLVVNGKGGSVLFPLSLKLWDLDSFKEIFWGGEYSAPFPFEEFSTYVDLGANTGMAAAFFATKTNWKKMILVEANPKLAEQIQRIQFPCATSLVTAFVSGSQKGTVDFYVHENHRNSGLTAASESRADKIAVPQIPLREILLSNQLSEVDLLKMDIEGGEYSLLQEDPSIFQKFRYVCAELHGSKVERDSFAEALVSLGFEILERRESLPICEMLYAKRK